MAGQHRGGGVIGNQRGQARLPGPNIAVGHVGKALVKQQIASQQHIGIGHVEDHIGAAGVALKLTNLHLALALGQSLTIAQPEIPSAVDNYLGRRDIGVAIAVAGEHKVANGAAPENR